MEAAEELLAIADDLASLADRGAHLSTTTALEGLQAAANKIGKSFSGSWWGYHSRVYYDGFAAPPAGDHFSQEWGLMDRFANRSRGRWLERKFDDVVYEIYQRAENPDLKEVEAEADRVRQRFAAAKAEILSILHAADADSFLGKLIEEVDQLEAPTATRIADAWAPRGQVMTRDTVVLGQGLQVPPHIVVQADVAAIRMAFDQSSALADLARKAGSHLSRLGRADRRRQLTGTNVFIGHGRSLLWRELKDFVSDRLRLPWDEFNRIPVAGVTNIARLSEMLEAASVAFIIMTAEDEMADGEVQARMNVIHEVGLFQGRLGFTKAIVLFEEGCKEFTNIQGLGQIRFPKGRISAVFEDVRAVLEREGILATKD